MTRSYLTTALVSPLLLQAGCDAKPETATKASRC